MAETLDNPTHAVRDAAEVHLLTAKVIEDTPVFDMHTHLFPPAFGGLAHWGIDSLVTYHYLVAELMRSADVRPEQYYRMAKSAQADLIWDTLFVRNTPLSEATRVGPVRSRRRSVLGIPTTITGRIRPSAISESMVWTTCGKSSSMPPSGM